LLEVARELLPAVNSPYHRAWLELECLRCAPAVEAAAGFESLSGEPAMVELPGLQLHAVAWLAQARLAAHDGPGARAAIERPRPAMEKLVPYDMNRDVPWFIAHDVFLAGGDTAAALHALQRQKECCK
jgi:hypothetical protein